MARNVKWPSEPEIDIRDDMSTGKFRQNANVFQPLREQLE